MSKYNKHDSRQSQFDDDPIIQNHKSKKVPEKRKQSGIDIDQSFVAANDWNKSKNRNRREKNLQKKHNSYDDDYYDDYYN